jgi:WD40 repeat protein
LEVNSLPLRIFLSHTSELAEFPKGDTYVDKAKAAIEAAGHVAVDMATFRAQSISAEEYDTPRVKECDVYIGIYGNKYGSITSKRISYTESEYDAAVEAELPRFIFLLDPDSSNTGMPAHALVNDRYTGKRRAFLKKASKEVIYKRFGNPDHLRLLISDALYGLDVTADCAASSQQDLIDPFLSPFKFEPYRKQRSKGFIGRDWLFQEVRNWLKDPNASQGMLHTAGFGFGKTAFIAQLVENNATGIPLAAQHFCQGGLNTTLSPGRFVISIAAQLAETLPAYRRHLQAPDAVGLVELLKNAALQPEDAWNQAVVALLHEIEAPGIDHLIVVDALELSLQYRPAVGEPDDVRITNLLAADPQLPSWIRILATSRGDDEVVESLSPKPFRHKPLAPDDKNNLSDLSTYIEERCQTGHLKIVLSEANLASHQVTKKLRDPKLSGGKLLYVAAVLDAVENQLIPLKSLRDFDKFPRGMSEFYRQTFRRHYSRGKDTEDYRLMRSILGLLCEQREELSLTELSSILETPKKQIRNELQILGSLISSCRRDVSRGGKLQADIFYSFDHSSLRLWLVSENESSATPLAYPYDVDLQETIERIRSWMLNQYQSQSAHLWPYLVRHLRSYITTAEWLTLRHDLLANIHWLQARLTHTGIYELMHDSSGGDDDFLTTLHRFVGQAEQTLRLFPQQLPSQILARLERQSPIFGIADLCQAAVSICKEQNLATSLFPSLNNARLLRQRAVEGAIQCLSYDRDTILFGCMDGRVGVWNLAVGGLSYSDHNNSHKKVVSAVTRISEDQFASASWDGQIAIWSLSDLSRVCEFEAHKEEINDLLFISIEGKSYLVSTSDDQAVKIWRITSSFRPGMQTGHRQFKSINKAHYSWITHLVYLGGSKIVTGSKDGTIRCSDIKDLSSSQPIQLDGEVISLSYHKSKDSLYVVTDPGEALPNSVYRINLTSLQIHGLTGFPDDIQTILCLKESDQLVFLSYSQDSMIFYKKWNEDGPEHRRLGAHDASINCLCQSNNKLPRLMSASIDCKDKERPISTIAIWDCADQADVSGGCSLQAHYGRVLLIWRNNSGEIYSVASDGSGCLWRHDGIPQSKWHFRDHTPIEVSNSSKAFVLTNQQFVIRDSSQLLVYESPLMDTLESTLQAHPCPLHEVAEERALVPTATCWSNDHGLIMGCDDGSIFYSAERSTTDIRSSNVVGSIEQIEMLDNNHLFCWSSLSSEDGRFWICLLGGPELVNYLMNNPSSSSLIQTTLYQLKSDDASSESQGSITFGKMELLHVCNEYLAIAHADSSGSIWQWNGDFQNPLLKLKHKLLGHASTVVAIVFLADEDYVTASNDRTVRRWQENGEGMVDTIIFVNDYVPTSLCLVEQTSDQSNPETLVVLGDEMGLVHWLRLS